MRPSSQATTHPRPGSHKLLAPGKKIALLALVAALPGAAPPDARAEESAAPAPPGGPANSPLGLARQSDRPALPETALGVPDRGIFSDLDTSVQIALPDQVSPQRARAVVDPTRDLLILYVDGWPANAYPLTGATRLERAGLILMLRPGDRTELLPLLTRDNIELLPEGRAPWPGDADRDGLPDPLDILIGAHKTVINQASYGAGYIKLDYPMGDVPRDQGVCTDVVIRAVRNAGLDIQHDVHRDIRRSGRAYPMVKGRGDKNIDHRRVKTLLPYFKRRWDRRSPAIDDPDDPLKPGDIVLMDTFPARSGPDHIGVVSNRPGASGKPLIINNWTNGTKTAEMDLLDWVPVTHRFRLRPSARASRPGSAPGPAR